MFPKVQPRNSDGMIAEASCQPDLVQRTWMSSLLLSTVTDPGDVRVQLPSLLLSVQIAPGVGGVMMLIDSEDPLTTEAHPVSVIAAATKKK